MPKIPSTVLVVALLLAATAAHAMGGGGVGAGGGGGFGLPLWQPPGVSSDYGSMGYAPEHVTRARHHVARHRRHHRDE